MGKAVKVANIATHVPHLSRPGTGTSVGAEKWSQPVVK
jgi:hypothetical protein